MAIQRKTIQRDAILAVLGQMDGHPTVEELHERLRLRLPQISLGTIYRNLEMFANAGQVRRLESPGKKRRYDADMSDHYHLHCLSCGQVANVRPEQCGVLSQMLLHIAEAHGMSRIAVEIHGTCEACSKNGAAGAPAPKAPKASPARGGAPKAPGAAGGKQGRRSQGR